MAEQGFILDIDTQFLRRLEQADKSLDKMVASVDRVASSLDDLSSGPLSNFASAIDSIVNSINTMSETKVGDMGLGEVSEKATEAADSVNRVLEVMSKLKVGDTTYSNSALSKNTQELETSIAELSSIQTQIHETLDSELEYVDTSELIERSNFLMGYIELLEQERESIIETSKVKIKDAKEQEELDKRWRKMEAERDEVIKERARIESELAKRSSQNYASGFRGERLAEQLQYADQQKEYERLFGPIARADKKLMEMYAKQNKAAKESSEIARKEFRAQEIAYKKMFDSIYAKEKAQSDKQNIERAKKEAQAEKERYELWLMQKHSEAKEHKRIEDEKYKATLETIRKQNEAYDQQEAQQKEFDKQNRSAKVDGNEARENYARQFHMYEKMSDEIDKRRRENERKEEASMARENAANKRRAQGVIDNYIKETEAARKSYEERQKMYERLFNEQEEQERRTVSGAMNYSANASSIVELKQAVKYLEDARDGLTKDSFSSDKEYKKTLTEINDEIKNRRREISELCGEQNKLNSIYERTKKLAAAAFSFSAIRGYVNRIVEIRGEFELQRRSLEALLGNKEEANRLWNQTIQLAVKSPFEVKQLITYTKQLAAYRVEVDKLHGATKMLADISAGLGVDMDRLILAYGQVKAANYLRGTELRQFSEAGINVLEELATYYSEIEKRTVSVGDVFERVSARMVSFEDVEKVLQRVTSAGGQFYRMQEIQSETLKGQMRNLKDSIDLMVNDIGKSNEGVLKASVATLRWLINNYEGLAKVLKIAAIAFVNFRVSALLAAKGMTSIKAAFNSIKSSISGLSLNPWILGLTVVAGIATKIVGQFAELRNITKEYANLVKPVKEVSVSFEKAFSESDVNGMKNALNELSKIAEKDFAIKASIDENASKEGIKESFDRLREEIFKESAFSQEFAKAFTKKENRDFWIDTQFWDWNLASKDIEQFADRANTLFNNLQLNSSNFVYELNRIKSELSDDELKALDVFNQPIGDRSQYEYLTDMAEAYGILKDRLKDTEAWSGALNRQFRRFGRTSEEVIREFEPTLKAMDELVDGLDDATKERRLKLAIDKLALSKDWDDIEKGLLYEITNKRYNIHITPIFGSPNQADSEPWVERVKSAVDQLNNEIIAKGGVADVSKLFPVPSAGQTKEQYIAFANEVISIVEKKYLEGQEIVDQSVVERAKLLNPYLEMFKKILNIGSTNTNNDSQEKTLSKRISLIKEMRSEYEKLRKVMGDTAAKERIIKSYGDTFAKAFEGTNISLTRTVFSQDKLQALRKASKEAGSIISESVLSEMDKLAENNTYIRNFSDELVEFIKKHEGFRAEVYKDVVGVKTQGYGETVDIEEGASWTEEKAEMVLRNSLAERYVTIVNDILDANKDLILTQNQYNALLDVAYHGGGGALKSLLTRVKDVDKGVKFIENIANKIKSTLGDDAAARFGEEFVKSFREAETIYERIAIMLRATNLTAGGNITSWYKGMQKIADWRADMFSGDLGVSQLIDQSIIQLANLDFTSITGTIDALKKLAPIAKKEGAAAELALSTAISELEAIVEVKFLKKEDADFAQDIEDMFSGYELSLELDKLNIPQSFAQQFFGLEAVDLATIKERLLAEKSVDKEISEERMKTINDSLQKISEMEAKSQQERLKKYLVYARDAVGERAKIKLEELKKLQEIELTFGRQSTPEKQRAIEKVQSDSYQATKKLDWEEFQKSDTFVSLFQDLDMASESLINHALTKLQEFKDSWKDMPHEEMKSIVGLIEKLESQIVEIKNPFASAKKLREELKSSGSIDELLQSNVYEEEKMESYRKEIAILEEIIQLRSESKDEEARTLAVENERNELSKKTNDELAFELEHQKDMFLLSTTIVAENNKKISKQKQLNAAYQKQSHWIQEAQKTANELYGAFKNLAEVLGEDDSPAAMFAEMGMSMANTVTNTIVLQNSLKSAKEGADKFGRAMNTAMGIIGWIVMAVQLITEVLSTAFKIHDNKLEKQIQRIQERVEDLEERWERINELMSEAFSTVHLREYSKEAKKNLEEQIKSYEQMIELEERKKKTDHGKVDEWRKSMKELKEEYRELLKEEFSIATAGIMDDVLSTTRGFVDAWHDAFMETRDGMSGLKNNFRELLQDIMRQQAALTIVNPFVSMYKTKLEELLNNNGADMELTLDEAREWRDSVEKTLPEVDKLLSNFFEGAGSLLEEQGELSELSKGIQGVTESTAQILEALLNSMRFFVADTNASVKNIESAFMSSDVSRNPILNELQQHTQLIRSIESMFDSVIGHGGSTHIGGYIKVKID